MSNSPEARWRPTISLPSLQLRSEIVWKLRCFFREHGLLEVHTPLLGSETVVDRHIDPVTVPANSLGLAQNGQESFYLQTSPEFAMKRLLAAGSGSIYQISSVFRSGERGSLHNPEFTMAEWYRLGDNLEQGIEFLTAIVRTLIPNSDGLVCTYQQAFQQFVGICPLSCDFAEFPVAAARNGIQVDADWTNDRDEWLNLLFAEVVQPHLGFSQPTVVSHFPASQSALAQICGDDFRVAERFELFIDGVEIANGYHELLCGQQLVQRNQKAASQRQEDGKDDLNGNGLLLAAMQSGIPNCSGCAMGLDRLLMVLTKARTIDEVICFPIERA